jgi:hypothetical protein
MGWRGCQGTKNSCRLIAKHRSYNPRSQGNDSSASQGNNPPCTVCLSSFLFLRLTLSTPCPHSHSLPLLFLFSDSPFSLHFPSFSHPLSSVLSPLYELDDHCNKNCVTLIPISSTKERHNTPLFTNSHPNICTENCWKNMLWGGHLGRGGGGIPSKPPFPITGGLAAWVRASKGTFFSGGGFCDQALCEVSRRQVFQGSMISRHPRSCLHSLTQAKPHDCIIIPLVREDFSQ